MKTTTATKSTGAAAPVDPQSFRILCAAAYKFGWLFLQAGATHPVIDRPLLNKLISDYLHAAEDPYLAYLEICDRFISRDLNGFYKVKDILLAGMEYWPCLNCAAGFFADTENHDAGWLAAKGQNRQMLKSMKLMRYILLDLEENGSFANRSYWSRWLLRRNMCYVHYLLGLLWLEQENGTFKKIPSYEK